jgi:hypothetical protein
MVYVPNTWVIRQKGGTTFNATKNGTCLGRPAVLFTTPAIFAKGIEFKRNFQQMKVITTKTFKMDEK